MSPANAPRALSQRSPVLRRCAAAAAAVGGTAWAFKAGLTLATGDEPPAAFAIGFALFPFALLGLWSTVRRRPLRAARIGGALAGAAAVSVVLATIVRAVGGAAVEGGEDELTVLTPFVAVAAFATFAALLALGSAVRRTSALPAGYASLPWAMGLATILLLLLGGALEAVSERLLELPIALLAVGWVALGRGLWTAQPAGAAPPTAPTNPNRRDR